MMTTEKQTDQNTVR